MEANSAGRALRWLWAQQQPDGLLAADTYGALRRGESVTAAALLATAQIPTSHRGITLENNIARAFEALRSHVRREQPTDYETYTAACHLHALCLLQPNGWRQEAEQRVAELRQLQCSQANGWHPSDPAYGGFGLGDRVPQKPFGGDLVTLSTTVTVLEAVRIAGMENNDAMFAAAQTFVERCQHFDGTPAAGGFFAAPTEEWRGGKGGRDATGRKRAYGTATADGLRALIACGLEPAHPRIAATATWLRHHKDSQKVPGLLAEFEPALRCYWAASRIRALHLIGEQTLEVPRWLLDRQRDDGAFVGFSSAMKEDEPVVGTVLALFAFAATASR